MLSRRVRGAIARAGGVPMSSFTGQAMLEIIQSMPRIELFSMNSDTLYDTVSSVVGMRRQVRLFVRVDPFGRYVSCLVYLPRDRYTTRVRTAMQQILMHEYGGGAQSITPPASPRVTSRCCT